MRLEPEGIDELLEAIIDPTERIIQLWYLHDYTDRDNPEWWLLTYDQWVGFTDKYVRTPNDF